MHLVVIQHGLWGNHNNTQYLAQLLAQRLGEKAYILNSDVNNGNLTYDGIDVCGDRLHALVLQTLDSLAAQGRAVRQLSFVGYSMGGLITRYVAGRLFAEGMFGEGRLLPLNFVTVATPHLGAWRMPSTWVNRAFNYMIPVVTSRSGHQMVLQDKHTWGKPLMCLLSHPGLLFMRALRCFKQLMLLANVFHDRPVPYCTAAIRLDNPYERTRPVALDPRYPSVVTTPEAAAARAKAAAASGAPSDPTAPGPGAPGSAGPRQQPPPAAAPPPLHAAPRRRLHSMYLPLLSLFCLPLFVPAVLLMIVTGRAHDCRISRMQLDFSWIETYTHGHGGARRGSGGGRGDEDARQSPPASAPAGGPPPDIECPSAPELPPPHAPAATPAASAAAAPGASSACVAAAPASRTAAGALDDGEDDVVVSESAVLLHDGIALVPAEVHRVQQWLAEQLNTLPWVKVDVDCRDLHAHAAIIVRNPARFKHCRDALDYMVDHWLRE